MRRLLAVTPVLALLAAAPAAPAASDPQPFFSTPCGFSHRAADDPIVAPGRPGAAHLHDFFGNRSTSAASTYESLRDAATTCRRSADGAAYWVPTLFTGDGSAVRPSRAQIYYRGHRHRDPGAVRAFPADLRVIAGRAAATEPQPLSVVNWNCGSGSGVKAQQAPPMCPEGHELRLQVRFPECWDGARLDSPDHASHLAYAARGRCPASHPVAVPQIVLNIRYGIRDGRGATLSSGPPHTAHADFLNAWDQDELERLTRVCIRGRRGNERVCKPDARPPLPLSLSSGTVSYRGQVTLAGDVGGSAGRPVRIQYLRRGAWESLAVVSTGSGGSFAFSFRAGSSRRYRALAPGGRSTEVVRVTVRPRIPAFTRRRGDDVTVFARTTPMKSRLVFRAERLVAGRWRTAARRQVRARRGRASQTFSLRRPGTYRVRVLSRGDGRHAAGRSRPREIAVR